MSLLIKPPTTWTIDHYKALILLHASYGDYDYSNEEKTFIESEVGAEVLKEVEKVYHTLNESNQLFLLEGLSKRFLIDETIKEEIKVMLERLYKSDGTLSRPELILQNFLEKLLNL